jgi:hypothetical protein
MKSLAPRDKASMVIFAPFSAIEERMTTGILIPCFFLSCKNSMPFISGISKSRIMTSGFTRGIF